MDYCIAMGQSKHGVWIIISVGGGRLTRAAA